MQRLTLLLVGAVLTWLTPAQAQTPDYIIQNSSAPLRKLSSPNPPKLAQAGAEPSAPLAEAKPARPALRIGVLLPVGSATLGEAARVVKSGVEAAAAADADAELVPLDAGDGPELGLYQAAVRSGVDAIIGPLSREAIAELAPQASVPTLALNAVGRELSNPKFYTLSLTVEGEARQLARLMREDGRVNPLLLFGADALSQRLRLAFVEAWRAQSGRLPAVLEVKPDTLAAVQQAVIGSDAVFMALDTQQAAAARAALPAELPVYATSQINDGSHEAALAGVRFIDMPWFLMPEHPAVKRYARPTSALTPQTERLYALGVDAWRVARQLAVLKPGARMKLDGVSGDLSLGRDRVFERQLPLGLLGK